MASTIIFHFAHAPNTSRPSDPRRTSIRYRVISRARVCPGLLEFGSVRDRTEFEAGSIVSLSKSGGTSNHSCTSSETSPPCVPARMPRSSFAWNLTRHGSEGSRLEEGKLKKARIRWHELESVVAWKEIIRKASDQDDLSRSTSILPFFFPEIFDRATARHLRRKGNTSDWVQARSKSGSVRRIKRPLCVCGNATRNRTNLSRASHRMDFEGVWYGKVHVDRVRLSFVSSSRIDSPDFVVVRVAFLLSCSHQSNARSPYLRRRKKQQRRAHSTRLDRRSVGASSHANAGCFDRTEEERTKMRHRSIDFERGERTTTNRRSCLAKGFSRVLSSKKMTSILPDETSTHPFVSCARVRFDFPTVRSVSTIRASSSRRKGRENLSEWKKHSMVTNVRTS